MASRKRTAFDVLSGNATPAPKRTKINTPEELGPVEDKLLPFYENPAYLDGLVGLWLAGNAPGTGANASLPGNLQVVPRGALKFVPPVFEELGPCWAFSTRTKVNGKIASRLKLVEGGSNSDSPR